MIKRLSVYVIILLIAALDCSKEEKAPLTIATVCMNAVTDKEANLQEIFSYMDSSAERGAHLIVFPEIALQQCPAWGNESYRPSKQELKYVFDSAETIPGEGTERIIEKAKELNLYVIYGMAEKVLAEDSLYNTSVFLGPNGIVGKYRKINLWEAKWGGNEHLIFKHGKDLCVFESEIGKVGLLICADMHAHLGPKLANEGADILVTVSAWPDYMGELYEKDTKQNAIEAQRWHVVSNQVGSVGDLLDYGHSRIIDPNGNIVIDTDQKEGLVIAETDLLINLSFTKK